MSEKPAYQLECRNCDWNDTFFFWEVLPEKCGNSRCNRPRHKITSLKTGTGYTHRRPPRQAVNWEIPKD